MSATIEYWKECISNAAEECGLSLTAEQLDCLADAIDGGHEHYGQAFYSPSWGERFDDMMREEGDKLKRLQAEFDAYRNNAETAVKQALRQYDDANISIHEHGEVLRHTGRTERIQ